MDGSIGAYTTEELLGWFRGIVPDVRQKKDIMSVDVPVAGKAKDDLMRREYGAAAVQEYNRDSGGEEENGDPSSPNYEPQYNLNPDDEETFDFNEDFDPGNPTNPKAKPGDHDYGVDWQSTDVYNDFLFEEDNNPRLPIHEYESEILETIRSNKVRPLQQDSLFLITC